MKNKVLIILLAFTLAVFSLPSATVAYAQSEQYVYLGGMPIGIGLAESGLIVTGTVDVITDEGSACPARGSEILTGDVIVKVNGKEIMGISYFASEVQRSKDDVILTVKRGEREMTFSLTPVTDSLTGQKKLGLTLKSGINGIGTMTFVTEDMHFAALGHGIVDADTGKTFISDTGSVYSCEIIGYKRASGGKPGELRGKFLEREHPIGHVNRCNQFGIYGTLSDRDTSDMPRVPIANRKEVKTGAALIYSTVSGEKPKAYKVEIVKAQSQQRPKEKSMLIRVVDKDLLDQTGGILQGMSGSPIVQNGKLIGAVTHVLVNDSTLGYGLYIDWMLQNVA